jgi:hypothetical protein
MKRNALALMVTASFCSGVQNKRYSEQQEKATKNYEKNICIPFAFNTTFLLRRGERLQRF